MVSGWEQLAKHPTDLKLAKRPADLKEGLASGGKGLVMGRKLYRLLKALLFELCL